MIINFSENNNKTSLDEIEKFEKKAKVKLPEEYKEFMIKHNGGSLESNQYKIYIPPQHNKKRGSNSDFSIFDLSSLNSLFNSLKWGTLIEDSRMLSIGDLDGGGIYICISGNDYGKVFFAAIYCIGMDYLIEGKYLKAADNFNIFIKRIKYTE